MNITMVDQQGEEIKSEGVELKNPETTPVLTGELLNQSVGQMFNLRPDEISHDREKIGLLVRYAKTLTDNHSAESIKWAIRSLQGRVGTPPLGEKWLSYLSKFAYLSLEEESIKKEKDNYIRNSLKQI